MQGTVHMPISQTAFQYKLEVKEDGRIEIDSPFPSGSQILVVVMEQLSDSFSDLISAAESSLDFWDNPFDDEDWNYA